MLMDLLLSNNYVILFKKKTIFNLHDTLWKELAHEYDFWEAYSSSEWTSLKFGVFQFPLRAHFNLQEHKFITKF